MARTKKTSLEAYLSLSETALNTARGSVLAAFHRNGAMIDEELERHLQGVASPSSIRTRRRELFDDGVIIDTGKIALTKSGRKAVVWALDPNFVRT